MLFKIELSPEIKSIGREQIGPGQNRPEKFYEDECNGETDKCDGFADDNYTVTVLETGSVQSLFKFLDEFEKLTGLSCNKNKTTCLRIGCENNNVPTEILDLGLDWATEIKMLGFTFGNSNNIINKNFDTVSKKVKKIINYWNRFGLSIVGRITVIKSLVMPHIGFVGSILEPPENWISDTENIILKFAAGKKIVAKDRIYADPELGGLGLIPLDKFLDAMKCTWITKALHSKKMYGNVKYKISPTTRKLCSGSGK
jgi:hypothetical protein